MRRILLLLLPSAVFLLWQNVSIQREEKELFFRDLPAAFQDLRLVHISDLHGRVFGQEHSRLLKAVRDSEPDLICITGDLFGTEEELQGIHDLLQGLCELAPTYYVTGNHEWQLRTVRQHLSQMEQLGVEVLRNEYKVLQRQGGALVIAGVDDSCGPYERKSPAQLVEEIRRDVGQESFVLMLSHRNDELELWQELGVDLVLSGHCQGGVVRLPFVGGVFGSGRELFPEYDAGLYEKGNTQLFVSRGLGYSRVKFRLFNRPHLPVLILKGK